MIFFGSRKRYSIGEVLKRIFFRIPGIARLVAVERDVKPQNMNFAKVEKRGGGAINREGAFIRINTVTSFMSKITSNLKTIAFTEFCVNMLVSYYGSAIT